MRISTFFYTLKQGIVNIFRNKWYSLASLATITTCLLMFGVFYSVVMNFQYILKSAQEGVAVKVFFEDGISEDQILKIGDTILNREEVLKAEYVSATEAWEEFSEDYLGEYADGYTDNPLKDCANYKVYLKDVSKQQDLVAFVESIEGVREVVQSALTANMLSGVNKLVGYVSIGIILILLAVSTFLISNTVTIGISVRKEEISIMKYIGATDFFVRSPFVIEGIIIGAVGAAIPLGVMYVLYNKIIGFVIEKFNILSQLLKFLTVEQIFTTLIPVSLILGIGIGFIGSFITVRKHIRV